MAAALAGGLITPTLAVANTVTWTGVASYGSTNWSYSLSGFTNWFTNQLPANDDSLIFDGVLGLTNTNNYLDYIHNLTFATGAGAFTLNGGRLTISGDITNESNNVQTINLNLKVGAQGSSSHEYVFDGGSKGLVLNGDLSWNLGDKHLRLTNKVTLDLSTGSYSAGDVSDITLSLDGGSSLKDINGILGNYDASNTGAVNLSGSGTKWINSGYLLIGGSGKGTVVVSGGALLSNKTSATLGEEPGGNGSVTVSGQGSQWANTANTYIGKYGGGVLTINSHGQVSNVNAYLGYDISLPGKSKGTANVQGAGSTWTNSGNLYVGYGSVGVLNISGGANVTNTTGYVGYASGSDGKVTVSNIGSLWQSSGDLIIGESGKGTLTIKGGALVRNATGYISNGAHGVGVVTVSDADSMWINAGNLFVGNAGNGTLNILSGGRVDNIDGYIGYGTDSDSHVTVDGADSQWNNAGSLFVGGDASYGTLSIQNGGLVTASTLRLSGGTYLVLDGGTLRVARQSGVLNVGGTKWISGTVNYTGDASVCNGWFGMNCGVNHVLTLTGGQMLQVDGTLTVGAGKLLKIYGGQVKSGALGLTGGSIDTTNGLDISDTGNVTGHGTISGPISGGVGKTITANGGQLTLGNANVNGSFNYSGSLNTGANQIDLLSLDKAQLGNSTHLGNGGRLNTINGANLAAGNALTYSGNASIGGNFTNNGAVSGSGGALTFLGDVNGAGSFAGDIVFHAGFNPGNSPATVSFNGGNATYDATSVLTMEILGATPGSEYDQLVDIDLLTFNGTLKLVFADGYMPGAGTSFDLFDFQSFSGTLAPDHIQVVGLDANLLDFSQLATTGTLAVAAVPEPETYALMLAGLGLIGLAVRRRVSL